jgi:hypothetical protein
LACESETAQVRLPLWGTTILRPPEAHRPPQAPATNAMATSAARTPLGRTKRAKRARPTFIAAPRPTNHQIKAPSFIHITPWHQIE